MATRTVKPGTMTGAPIVVREIGTQGPKLPGGLRPQTKAANAVWSMAHASASGDRLRGFYDRRMDAGVASWQKANIAYGSVRPDTYKRIAWEYR